MKCKNSGIQVFTCSSTILEISFLLLIGFIPTKATILIFWYDIFIQNVYTDAKHIVL